MKPGEPRDAWAYRLAIGGVGLALVSFLIGGAIIGASGHAKEMVQEYWTIGAALSGALVGILAPSPRQKRAAAGEGASAGAGAAGGEGAAAGAGAAGGAGNGKKEKSSPFEKFLSMIDVALLFLVVVGSLLLAPEVNATDAALLRTIAAAAAGAIVGLLAPSPIKTGPG
jgi:hypothetical protein